MSGKDEIQKRASFDIIRYANCWEDTEILIEALNISKQSRCFSISSAGDNALALLTREPELVVAIDINPLQLALTELKIVCFKELEYNNLLSFLGFAKSNIDRLKTYEKLSQYLTKESKEHLDNQSVAIKQGVIHTGKFERYFHTFCNRVIPLIHNRKTVAELLQNKPQEERISFYNKKWNNFRWQLMFKIFFSRFVMGHLGRDPEFFRYVKGNVARDILKRTEYAFTVLPTDDNPYLKYIMTGSYDKVLPFYVKKENFELIKNNIDKLKLFSGTPKKAFKMYDEGFDCFNLSDIFEYMDLDLFKKVSSSIIDNTSNSARLVYWNMLVNRKISEAFPEQVKYLRDLSEELFKRDKAFFYQAFFVEEVL